MTVNKSTPQSPKNPVSIVNDALKLRVRYFKSLRGGVLVVSFDSGLLNDNPHFIEIDAIEYRHLVKELES